MIELTIDEKSGRPIITIRHYYKESSLKSKLLNVFLENAKTKGIRLQYQGGVASTESENCFENFEIQIIEEKIQN